MLKDFKDLKASVLILLPSTGWHVQEIKRIINKLIKLVKINIEQNRNLFDYKNNNNDYSSTEKTVNDNNN